MADDLGVLYTDKQLSDMERTLSRLYTQAGKDIENKLADFTEKMEKKEAVYAARVKEGTMTQADFDHWKSGVVFRGKQWTSKMTQVSLVLANTNAIALSLVKDKQLLAFGMNSNYAAYEIEHGFKVSFGFDIYNQKAVARLLSEKPNILPFKKLDKKKDIRWNFKNIRSQVAQGIIQGESIPKIAKRLAEVVPNRNEKQMVLHARTAMTSAQNTARLERFREAEERGIKLQKRWDATLDSRTRDTHRDLDGQVVGIDEPFEINGMEIMEPGDPHAQPELVYNCRCRLGSVLNDYPERFRQRRAYNEWTDENGKKHRESYVIGNMTYREWEAWKNNGGK